MSAFLSLSDVQVFAEPHVSDPAYDVARVRLRDQLAALHTQIYPEIRARKWDLHPHWIAQNLISTARISPTTSRIDFLLLRYAKAETVVWLMKKEFGEDFSPPDRTALIRVRVDQNGLAVELCIGARAWVDAKNFTRKLAQGAPDKRHLSQLLAELGRDYTLTLAKPDPYEEILRVRCSRLLNLGALDATLAKFSPGTELKIAVVYAPDDVRLDMETLPKEIVFRLGQLYLLYQYISWSPRNNYLAMTRTHGQESELSQ